MSIGLSIVGKLSQTGDLSVKTTKEQRIEVLSNYFKNIALLEIEPKIGIFDDGGLSIGLIHGEEEIFINLEQEAINVEARTCSGGPGYHLYLVSKIKQLGWDYDIRWIEGEDGIGDDTGFWESEEPQDILDAMQAWLKMLAESLAPYLAKGNVGFAISMNRDREFENKASMVTPVGRFDKNWIESYAAKGDGTDLWIWTVFEQSHTLMAGSAKAYMATEVRWRKPMLEEEEVLLRKIMGWLKMAHYRDRSMKLPFREWIEIAEILGETVPATVHEAAKSQTGHLLGYNRDKVTYAIWQGLKIKIDGSLWQKWDDPIAFEAGDDETHVRISPYRFSGEPPTVFDNPGERIPLPSGFTSGSAVLNFAEGHWDITSCLIEGNNANLVTIVCKGQDRKQAALNIFHGISA